MGLILLKLYPVLSAMTVHNLFLFNKFNKKVKKLLTVQINIKLKEAREAIH